MRSKVLPMQGKSLWITPQRGTSAERARRLNYPKAAPKTVSVAAQSKVALSFLLALAVHVQGLAAPAPRRPEIAGLVAQAARYETGQSREALRQLEELVGQ